MTELIKQHYCLEGQKCKKSAVPELGGLTKFSNCFWIISIQIQDLELKFRSFILTRRDESVCYACRVFQTASRRDRWGLKIPNYIVFVGQNRFLPSQNLSPQTCFSNIKSIFRFQNQDFGSNFGSFILTRRDASIGTLLDLRTLIFYRQRGSDFSIGFYQIP